MNLLQEILYIIGVSCIALFMTFAICAMVYNVWDRDVNIFIKIFVTILASGLFSLAIAQGMNRTGD